MPNSAVAALSYPTRSHELAGLKQLLTLSYLHEALSLTMRRTLPSPRLKTTPCPRSLSAN